MTVQMTKIDTHIYHLEKDYSDEYVTYKAGYYHIDETEDYCGPYVSLTAVRIAYQDLLTNLRSS